MPFASSRGYSSLTLQHDVAKLLPRRYAQTKQSAIIYFVSDLDASGLDLQRAWEQAMRDFGVDCIFVRLALILDQVQDPELDLERLAIDVKPGDKRAASYIEQYGRRCWEVDVLPADVIEEALDDHVLSWLNRKLWRQRDAEIKRARARL
jgi:hypothetical protein